MKGNWKWRCACLLAVSALAVAGCGQQGTTTDNDNDGDNGEVCYAPEGTYSQNATATGGDCPQEVVDDYIASIDPWEVGEEEEECGTLRIDRTITEDGCTFSEDGSVEVTEEGFEDGEVTVNVDCPEESIECDHDFDVTIELQ